MNDHFLSCDWGTSNFRLRLVSLADLHVVDEVASDKGVAGLSKAWQAKGGGDEPQRMAFYMDVLKEHVAQLKARGKGSLDDVPVIISGMASSTIGLANLPYQHLPVPTDGSGLTTKSIEPSEDFRHRIVMISGVQSEDDVMRGEETQLIGCMTQEMEQYDSKQLVIHPGTHSKHITIASRQVTGFRTFMSGEFFNLLTTHGILRDNVAANPFAESGQQPFERGVRDAINTPLLHAAFKVRTNDLFQRLGKEDNYHYLSGVLISTELQELRDQQQKMYLCCGPTLIRQYSTALRILDLDKKVTVFPAEWEESSVVRGQAKVLKQQINEQEI